MKITKSLHKILKKVTIFSGIDDEHLCAICSKCHIVKRKKGDVIIEEDTDATEIFVLLKGRLKIILNAKDEPIELVEMGPGKCIGEASVIGVQRHSASAIITENSEFLVLSRKALMNLYAEDKEVFSLLLLNIARELARRLHQTDHILIHYVDHHNIKENNE